ncbi:MAG: RNA polymerase sigma factor [Bacteroidota bacterium]
MPPKDWKYIEGLRNSDSQVIQEIYSRYSRKILDHVKTNSGSASDGDDVFQEALIIIYRMCLKEDFALTASFYTLLYGVASRVWLKQLAKRKRAGEVMFDESGEYIDEDRIAEEMEWYANYQLMLQKIDQLPDNCRKIIQLCLQGKKPREITKLFQYKAGVASGRIAKCKDKLRKLMGGGTKELSHG